MVGEEEEERVGRGADGERETNQIINEIPGLSEGTTAVSAHVLQCQYYVRYSKYAFDDYIVVYCYYRTVSGRFGAQMFSLDLLTIEVQRRPLDLHIFSICPSVRQFDFLFVKLF